MAAEQVIGDFTYAGRRVVYEIRGDGPRTTVLIHGLLLPAHINGALASGLAERGNRVVLLDLLGHGRSDKPRHASEHRLEFAGEQTLGLLDHLGVDEAVVGGVSLGANVGLQVGVTAPERLRGLICEMPVLERGTVGVLYSLAPLLVLLRYGGWPLRGVFQAAKRVPRTPHEALNALLDTAGELRSMAAVLHGYTVGPACPPMPERRQIEVPTLVIGHGRDWMHPIDDAEALVQELPNARLVRANSVLEVRATPQRIVTEIAAFLDDVWRPTSTTAPPKRMSAKRTPAN